MLRQSARGEHVVQMKLIGMLIQQRGYENGTEQKAEAAKYNGYHLHKVTLEALEI